MKCQHVERLLPIAPYKEQILESVSQNVVTIIDAETGAGKSSQVPKFLLESGKYSKIIVSVPSRTAASSLASRVAHELGTELGTVVGFQTGYEKNFSSNTRILYRTDGLELMKELHQENNLKNGVLIIDELQEWSIEVETLLAWVKNKLDSGWKTKIVLMSASMDARTVSNFFDSSKVISVPGKIYPVEEMERRENEFISSILQLYHSGHNVLVFVPGKKEIENTIRHLERPNLNAVLLPLHGDMPLEEQQLVFKEYNKQVIIVATNVAQTSITIPYIDAVVDSGLERHMEDLEGLEALTTGLISRSDYIQRRGRAGRTKPGIYIWCNDTSISSLREYPIPDIYTGCINQIVLKLASIDINAKDISFFHQPSEQKIIATQKTLRTLGAFDENNKITEIGQMMARLPISVRYSRMIVEGLKLGVLADVITIAAIEEIGGLKQSNISYRAFSSEMKSDLLADLDVFNTVKKNSNTNNISNGILERNYFRVLELRRKIYDIFEVTYNIEVTSTGDRNNILKACASGLVEFLYTREINSWYKNPSDPSKRKLNIFSCTLPDKFILGLPRNISLKYKGDNGFPTLYLISSATMVNADLLKEIAPHLINELKRKSFDLERNEFLSSKVTCFGEVEIDWQSERISNNQTKREILASWLADKTFNSDFEKLPRKLDEVLSKNQMQFSSHDEAYTFYLNTLEKMKKIPTIRKMKSFSEFRV